MLKYAVKIQFYGTRPSIGVHFATESGRWQWPIKLSESALRRA